MDQPSPPLPPPRSENGPAQSFQVVKDTIFPSQVYLKELNTFREKLEKLESEFSKLQGALQAPPVKKDGPVHITLKDLLNVKLKKTNSSLRMDKGVS
ncbi:hypothetical protein DUI87_12357 [Hirundo rustica rustica]|uniref:Uncharacterized protein n=1 Tax=Hirundo rustica rustica TaxID=333673 RepID=A0A3M0KBS0_HIRRU|nr:hypothetical protein DUI87_12357 [Hirundo rustica rustica]